jgi:hypothetical protein
MRSLLEVGGYVFSLLLVLVLSVSISTELAAKETIDLEDAEIRIEVNDTDGDAGLQLFADGEPWSQMKVTGPGGKLVYSVSNKGGLKKLGSTEFFTESNEPNYLDVPLPEILSFMPEGEYEFEGMTIDKKKIVGTGELTHNLPCGPELIFPMDGDELVLAAPLVIEWMPVTNKIDTSSLTGECELDTDIDIIRYELIIEIVDSDPEQKLTVIIPAGPTPSYEISPDFVIPGAEAEYKFEVIAREESGNQTITEGNFSTTN